MERKERFDWKAALVAGAIAGIPALLLTLVGMVLAFGKRYIVSGILTVGHTLLFINMVLAAVLALRRARYQNRLYQLLNGAVAGFIPGALVALWVAVGQAINLRTVFINSSPDLYGLLTFGLPWYVGLALLVAIGTALGLATAALNMLPGTWRRAVVTAVGVLLMAGLLQDLLRVMFQGWGFVGYAFLWIFPSGGISIPGMFFLLVVVGGLSYLWQWRGGGVRERLARLPTRTRRGLRWGSWGLAVLLLLLAPYILGSYPSEVLDMVGLFALMGLGLNIVVGFCGLLDLGYVAFFAIGAYSMALLTSPEKFVLAGVMEPWSFWPALLVAMAAACLAGFILGIPVLNTRGDYLAIVTLGFGEIVRLVFLSDWLRPFVGGAQGIQEVPNARIGSFAFKPPQEIFYLILAGLAIVVFVSNRLKDSRLGRAWMAVREDEDVAQAMGIPLVPTKLLAFATGATFAGLSGAIFASKLGSIYPHSFQLLYSIYVLSLLIVGGMGSIPGAIVGSLLLIGLPELLREFAEYRMFVYGAVLVYMMLTKPQGFLPPKVGRSRKTEEVG